MLRGTKVVELGASRAAAFAAKLMADMVADVSDAHLAVSSCLCKLADRLEVAEKYGCANLVIAVTSRGRSSVG